MKILYPILLASLLFLGACEKEERNLAQIEDEQIKAYLTTNGGVSAFTKDTSGIYYQVITPGTGVQILNSTVVALVQKTKTIDNSYSYEFSIYNPLRSPVGYLSPSFNQSTPSGWRLGLLKIKKGGKIRLIIPSKYAYGKDGLGSVIPGNAILDSEIEVLDDTNQAKADEVTITRFLAANNITNAIKDPTGLYYQVLEPGTGTESIQKDADVTATYTGKFLTGQQFTSASSQLTSLLDVIQGWQIGIPNIKKGGKIRLFIPSVLAYGAEGTENGTIPPNTCLDFEITVTDFKNYIPVTQ